jgi:hypothetical protein
MKSKKSLKVAFASPQKNKNGDAQIDGVVAFMKIEA